MRTNKACPLHTGGDGDSVTLSQEHTQLEPDTLDGTNSKLDDSIDDSELNNDFDDSDELMNVEGTKIKMYSKVIKVSMTRSYCDVSVILFTLWY